jgi:CubicO group peptidase (beta-lactamase class C family)
MLARIERQIEAARRETGVPGLSVAIVKDDKVVFIRGFGLRDIEHSLPVTPDTLFAIGSVTKSFTAMAAAILVDQGKLTFTDSPRRTRRWSFAICFPTRPVSPPIPICHGSSGV